MYFLEHWAIVYLGICLQTLDNGESSYGLLYELYTFAILVTQLCKPQYMMTYIHTYIYIYDDINTCIYDDLHTYKCDDKHTYVYRHSYIYIYIYIYM